jgi:hypothetical protein
MHCHAGCTFDDICAALNIEPKQLMPQRTESRRRGRIVETYDYCTPDGKMAYQAVRFEPKDFRQRRRDPNNPTKWIWDLKGVQPLLYRLPEVIDAVKNKKIIIIAEGEKDVNALVEHGFAATCNSGGAGKWPSGMSAFLTGATVIIIGDNDELKNPEKHTGRDGAYKTAKALKKYASEIYIHFFEDAKDPYDWFAAGHTRDEFAALFETWTPWDGTMPDTAAKPTAPAPSNDSQPYTEPTSTPFRFLGYSDGNHFYLPGEDLQLIRLSPDQHTQAAMINLAPLQWWTLYFPGGKTGPDWNNARNWMFRTSKKRGIYDQRRLRGRGTWFDNGRVVQHNGDHLVVDGERAEIPDFDSRYIYSAGYPIEPNPAPPIPARNVVDDGPSVTQYGGEAFLELCRMLNWSQPLSGTLFAGWCTIATIGGALPWRPHGWLTGKRGTGKTTILDHLVHPILGDFTYMGNGRTTAAAIYQTVVVDSPAIVIDECDIKHKPDIERIQSLIELARIATSGSTPIIKGGAGGRPTTYIVRSPFLFSSITVNLDTAADVSRTSVFSLTKMEEQEEQEAKYKAFLEVLHAVVTPEYCAGFRSRALSMVKTIIKNYEVFRSVVGRRFNDQRLGDQYGMLLAGAFSLVSNLNINRDYAEEWISKHDWSEQDAAQDVSDEISCLNHILEHVIRYQLTDQNIYEERAITEILYLKDPSTSQVDALARVGIRIQERENEYTIIISDSHKGLCNIFRGTPWEAKKWGSLLKRIPGAETIPSCYFQHRTYRATTIPWTTIYNELQ